MAEAGLAQQVALATDMAEAALWRRLGGSTGLVGLLTHIRPRLAQMGLDEAAIAMLLGGTIAKRLKH